MQYDIDNNMNKKFLFLLIIALFILGNNRANAHQPRLVGESKIINIINPELSQAFYGKLVGEPAVYKIEATEPFALYVNILVPDLPSIKTDFTVEGKKDGQQIFLLNGKDKPWEKFWEPFAGDSYLKGPEFKQSAPAGIYTITINNVNNYGKYVLAIGEREEFGFKNSIKTLLDLPGEKYFFDKPFIAIFQGRIIQVLAAIKIFFIATIVAIWYLIRRRKK